MRKTTGRRRSQQTKTARLRSTWCWQRNSAANGGAMNWSIRRCSYRFSLPDLFLCGKLRGTHRRSSPVCICEANSNQPEDQQDKWQDGWHNQQASLAYGRGEYLLLAKEEGTGRDKPSKAHAPEMARDAFGACNAAAQE